jgi:fibronectin-binding autotransporter adhesin
VNFRTIYVNGSTLTVGGPVINTVGSGNGGIMKYGAGTLKLTGGSGGTTNYAFFCYGGKTSIQGGTWWLNQTLNNNNLNVAGGATFEQTGGIVNSPLNPKISYYQTGSAGTSTGLFSGGTFNALGTFYVGLRNAAVMTVSGTAQLNLNGLQIGQQATFASIVNLNGGTVACSSVYTGGTASDHTSVLNFNGGKLQATANANPFISGLTTNNVSTNGAVIDSQSFAITIPQALIHDPALGATPDGGLTKLGTGTLTLSGTNTYTGVTTLAAGTLSINTLTNGGFNSSIGAASSASSNLVFSGGALSYTGPSASSDRGFTLAYGTNIITVTTASAALTLTGGCPTNTVFLKKLGAGTLVLDPGAGSVYSLGSLSADDGTLTLKSGTITTTRTNPNVTAYVTGAGARTGKLVVDGATLTVANGYRMTVGATASGNLDILSGTVNVGWLILGHNGTVTSTQGGGSVNAAELFHYDAGTATHTMTGGVLTVRRIYNWTKTTGATFTLNLNGGTIVAAAGTANLIDHNSQTNLPALEVAVKLGSVGATIDTSLSSATNVLPMVDMPGQAGRLTKIGTGTLSLTATNTYSGATIVSNGVLRLTHAQVLAVTNEVRIATGAMINLDFNGTQTIRRLYINDELMTINRRYGPDNLPASLSGTSGYLFTTEGAPPKGTLISFL